MFDKFNSLGETMMFKELYKATICGNYTYRDYSGPRIRFLPYIGMACVHTSPRLSHRGEKRVQGTVSWHILFRYLGWYPSMVLILRKPGHIKENKILCLAGNSLNK